MSAEDGMLYHTVVEKLDDVLHCVKTNCLVILSGAVGIVGLVAFLVCHFNQSRGGSKKKSQVAKSSPPVAKKPSKPEKKKEEDASAKKKTVKETKPASPVQKKKENKPVEPVVAVTPKTSQVQVPTKKTNNKVAAPDQHGEKSEDWVTVTSKKDRKNQLPRGKENEEAPNNKTSTKNSAIISPSKSGERPLTEKVQPSEPKVAQFPEKEKKPSPKVVATSNVALAHDASPPVASKETVSKKEASKSPTSSKSTAVKTPTSSSSSTPAVAKPATGGNAGASNKKASAAAPSVATPAPVAEGVDPEWTEIKGGGKKRSRAKKE